MASIHKEVVIEVAPEQVWDALRDVGALHTRLVVGFVSNCVLEADGRARVVTFANGMVARELIVDINEEWHRVAWSATGGQLSHHNASAQVFGEGTAHSRVVWIADLLPNELAPAIEDMIAQGCAAMKRTLELLAHRL
jgi:carbon monoxide dehydrogenase subunit G